MGFGSSTLLWQKIPDVEQADAAFLRGKGQILRDVTVDTGYVQLMNFLAPGSRDMFDAINKAVDYLFRALFSLNSIRCTRKAWLVESGRC
jgi:hypothetical protein